MSFNNDYAQQGQPTGEQPGAFASQTDLGQPMDNPAPGFPAGNMGGPAGAPQEGQDGGSNKTTLWYASLVPPSTMCPC